MAVLQRIYSKDKIRDRKSGRLIKSSQERYRDVTTGKVYSRRQRDKITKSISPMARRRERANFEALRNSFIAKQSQQGNKFSEREAALSPKLSKIIKDLEKGKRLRKEGKKEEGDNLIRDALERTDRRDNVNRDVIPGESPKAGIAE